MDESSSVTLGYGPLDSGESTFGNDVSSEKSLSIQLLLDSGKSSGGRALMHTDEFKHWEFSPSAKLSSCSYGPDAYLVIFVSYASHDLPDFTGLTSTNAR